MSLAREASVLMELKGVRSEGLLFFLLYTFPSLCICPADAFHRCPSDAFCRVRVTGRLRRWRESSWSRLCSADSVGSIPPNVYFVLLRRTRIHRAPPSDVAEGGHARRDQRTPTAFSPLRTDTPSFNESFNSSDKALRVHEVWTETCLLQGSAPSSLFFRH